MYICGSDLGERDMCGQMAIKYGSSAKMKTKHAMQL